ncbi:MAG: AAA family ATPase, partial [Chloroflexi bacterium]|nr:AAA family ATPase [Chloroflexota bacterium]
VQEGMGQVVLLSGEAGIGKSRLAQVLQEQVASDPEAWLTPCQCSPYHTNSALYPVIDLLERVVLQFDRGDTPQQRMSKLEGFLAQYGFALPEAVPLFASLLSIPPGEGYPPLNLTPERQKQKTLEALLRVLLLRASQQPVLLVVEDLHWVDPTTLELLSLIVDQGPTMRVLTLFTCRPDFASPWGGRSHLTQVTLGRLTRRQAADMVDRVAQGKGLPGEVVEQVVVKTDGVPLFVEELTKMVLESGLLVEREGRYELTGPLPPLAIPATLQDSLMARLDRLASVKEVAQLGSVLGREFSYEVLQVVSLSDEETLQRGLSQLVEAELLYQRGLPHQATYVFKHALVQEAAYQSLLKSRRQHYHQRIAQVLEERFPEMAETQPELLAHHYTEAGLVEQAIPCWQRAGERAAQRSACLEAIHHLKKGLELLKTLPDSPERVQRELNLQIALGAVLMSTKGWGAPEAEQVFARAQELCQQAEETPQVFLALLGIWLVYIARADYQTARKLGEQALGRARRLQDPALLMWTYHEMGVTFACLGELASAQEHVEQGIALYHSQQHRSFLSFNHDPSVGCLTIASYFLEVLGYPDQALKRSREALTLARGLSHPQSLAFALAGAAWFHQLRREPQEALQRAEAVIALATEQGFPLYLGRGFIFRGWALAEQGQAEEGIAQMRQGLATYRATGAKIVLTYFL